LLCCVHETRAHIAALQELIDRSFATVGAHLRSIRAPERRLTLEQVAEGLSGMPSG
jgi:hypothetical protein